MRSFLSRLWATLARGRRDRELDEEVRFHLEMLAEEYRARGMSPRKAGLAARREFGGAEQVKETYRDGRGFMALDSLLQDIRFALRMLRRERRFTVVAVSTLALGIGATTAMFAVVEHAILRPLPLPHADRLVAIESTYANSDGGHTSAPGVFVDWRESAESFEAMAGLSQATLTWVNPGTPRRVRGLRVSRDFFDVTGLPLLQGRTWTAEEDTPQGALVAIVTERFWKNDLNGDEGVLGRRIQLNESAYVVIGVAPSGFRLETVRDPEIFLPLQASQTSRFGGPVMTVGRRRPGVSLDAAQAEMETVMAGIRAQSPSEANTGVLLTPLHDWVLGDMRVILSAILGSVACVWLIGCANLSNMQLARSASRLQELAVRASLGAGRMRLIRQVLIETTVTASLGGAMGLPLAWGVLEILPEIESTYIPRAAEMRLSSVGIAFAVMAILLSGLLIGAAPALQAGRRSLNLALNGGAAFLGQSGGRLRSILVAAQLALSVMLLAGAGLLCNSFLRLLNVDLGFDRNGVIAIEPRHYKHLETETAVRLLSDLQTAVNRMQGVESTSLAQILSGFANGSRPSSIGEPGAKTASRGTASAGFSELLHYVPHSFDCRARS